MHVAELGSFTKAANQLDYSQSTISFQIKQLEVELGCLLFERINHTISLTERGRELLEYAHKISNLTEEFNQKSAKGKEINAHLHLLMPDSVCEEMVTAHYAEFHKRYPGISLKFTTADTLTMFKLLDHNEGDLMLTLDDHIYDSNYVIAKEEPVEMHFVTGASSPYATDAPLLISDIINCPFILTEKSFGYRSAFDKALASKSLEITPIIELGRTDIITSVLESGTGISFLPDFVTQKKVREGKLVYLNVTDINVDIWKQLIYHKGKWISNGLSALIEYIKENEFGGHENEMQ
jgi:DNA-binding transcriptional LysR family regulator